MDVNNPGDWETYEDSTDTPEEAQRRLAEDQYQYERDHGNDD